VNRPDFTVEEHPAEPGGFVLRGELDIIAAKTFTDATSRADGRIVLDVAELEFIDSHGMYALVSLARRLDASGGRVALQRPPRHLVRLMHVVALEDYFEVTD
jgi:anti-anti-sigma factor